MKPLTFALTTALLFALLTPSTAQADWNTGDPAKWVQMPDLSPQGMDVNASVDLGVGGFPQLVVLADDFRCTSTDPITDIHLWGSWKNDLLPLVFDASSPTFFSPDPGAVMFNLSIHADIPANQNPDGPFSKPGELLWSHIFNPGEFTARPWATNIEEGWLDPISGQFIFPGDTVAWQYNFLIPEDEAFIQQGTSTLPVVYWLDVAAIPQNEGPVPEEPLFGWKTSIDHFNDTAVYGPTELINWPNATDWRPIDSPTGVTQLDMAFVITPEPATLALLTLGVLAMLRRR